MMELGIFIYFLQVVYNKKCSSDDETEVCNDVPMEECFPDKKYQCARVPKNHCRVSD